jgi:IS1 family transposase
MAYETLKKRLSRCSITERRQLTLAYLLERATREEAGEYVTPDPRITDELLLPLWQTPGKTQPGRRVRANPGQEKVKQ